MKRRSNSQDLPQITYDYQGLLSSLKLLDRDKLLNIISEASIIIDHECSKIVSLVPEEIWKIILDYALKEIYYDTHKILHYETKYSKRKEMLLNAMTKLESTLQCFNSVCRYWAGIISELVLKYFKKNVDHSNWILNHFSTLSNLELMSSKITNTTIMKLTNLTSLTLGSGEKITYEGVSCLTNISNLSVGFCEFNAEDQRDFLKIFTNLKSLTLYSFSDFRFSTYEYLSNITSLRVSDKVPNRFLKHLTNLVVLSAWDGINDSELMLLSNLISLRIPSGDVTSESISKLTNLTSLDLGWNESISASAIEEAVNLKYLDIRECFAMRGLLDMSKLTKLESLYVSGVKLLPRSLRRLTNLTFLHFGYEGRSKVSCLENLPLLSHLALSSNYSLEDDDIVKLSNLTRLELLEYNQITDEGLSKLTNLKSLTVDVSWVSNDEGEISNEGLTSLVNLTSLSIRDPYDDAISDEGILSLTNLSEIDVTRNPYISIETLRKLTNLKNIICDYQVI